MARTRASVASAKGKTGKKDIDLFTIRDTNKVVRARDNVLMRPVEGDNIFPYVARVDKIEADASDNVMVHIRWHYRPVETRGGRREFHGAKEIFISDHFDAQSANTIEEKCVVDSFKKYVKLDSVAAEDYYCRFEFKPLTDAFIPDRVSVYCTCEIPYNPDILMVQCELCKDWYHPACVGMKIEDAKKLEHFASTECMSNEDYKRYMNVLALSRTNSHKRKQNEEEEDEQASG